MSSPGKRGTLYHMAADFPPAGSLVRFTHNRRALLRARDGSPNEARKIFVPKGTFGIVIGIVTADAYHYALVFVVTGGYVYVGPNCVEVMA